MTNPKTASEHQEQAALFAWAQLAQGRWPELSLLHAIPNGGKRSPATAALLKAEGVKPGVPDICLPVSRSGFHGMYIELKRCKGGKVSAEQKIWLASLEKEGYKCAVCHGWDSAREEIERYLEGRHA